MPEVYTIKARKFNKMSEFYLIFARKIFFPILRAFAPRASSTPMILCLQGPHEVRGLHVRKPWFTLYSGCIQNVNGRHLIHISTSRPTIFDNEGYEDDADDDDDDDDSLLQYQ